MSTAMDAVTIREIEQRIAKALEALPELDREGRLPEELRPLAHYLAPPPGKPSVVMLKNGKGEEGVVSVKMGAEGWTQESGSALIAHEASPDQESSKPCQNATHEPHSEGEELPQKPRKHCKTAWGFKPISIPGEPLSVTIMTDRR